MNVARGPSGSASRPWARVTSLSGTQEVEVARRKALQHEGHDLIGRPGRCRLLRRFGEPRVSEAGDQQVRRYGTTRNGAKLVRRCLV